MKQQTNKQNHLVTTATPEIERAASLHQAAKECNVVAVTLRSWCKKNHIQWRRVKIGAQTRCLVRISDVRAYLAKRNPSAVGAVGSESAMPRKTETTTVPLVPAALSQESVCAAPASSLAATSDVPACVDQVKSNRNTSETISALPSLESTTAAHQSAVDAKSATSPPPVSPKQKTKPPSKGASGLLMHRAKNSMRKFGADELQKISSWIKQRLAHKFSSTTNPAPAKQPTPAS